MITPRRTPLSIAIHRICEQWRKESSLTIRLAGFADAAPSESIQKHDLPGISVAVIFPFDPARPLLEVPVKQFKDTKKIGRKIDAARRLAYWLRQQKENGLQIHGFALTQTQLVAAEFGLQMLEELPEVSVKPHYDTFRLYFPGGHIDFAQAVALQYYLFSAFFGILQPSHYIRGRAELNLYMDRFPGTSSIDGETDGMRFIHYAREHSTTYRAIEKDHNRSDIQLRLTTLENWQAHSENEIRKGKTHPHFTLADWLVASSIATAFRGEFIACYSPHRKAVELGDACEDLYLAFKSFNVWSIGDKTLGHIKPAQHLWKVPEEARAFVMERASR